MALLFCYLSCRSVAGAHHGVELHYLFAAREELLESHELEVHRNITAFWGWLITSNDLTKAYHDDLVQLTYWPSYNPESNDSVLRFEETYLELSGRPATCDEWDVVTTESGLLIIPGNHVVEGKLSRFFNITLVAIVRQLAKYRLFIKVSGALLVALVLLSVARKRLSKKRKHE